MRKARETSAFAELKKFSTAQNIAMVENGRFARTLEELEAFGGGLLAPAMVQASHRASPPEALNGYYFSEVEPRTSLQAGLAAYPETIGKTGDKVIMILIDESRGDGPTEERPISGDNSRIFFAPGRQILTLSDPLISSDEIPEIVDRHPAVMVSNIAYVLLGIWIVARFT